MQGVKNTYGVESISDFSFNKGHDTDFKTYEQSYRIFCDLFKRSYPQYKDYMDISDQDVRNARSERFANDEYWAIWRQYGNVVGFIEAFFHKQNGFNMLPRIFSKYPDEIPTFQNCEEFLKRFKDDKVLVVLFEDCGITRMRHTIAETIWNAVFKLQNEYGGVVPQKRWQLLNFNGFGRKIANMLMNLTFDLPEIGIDVRVFRAACNLGFIPFSPKQFASDSIKFEAELILRQSIPQKFFLDADYLLFMSGAGEGVHSPKPKVS
ncbi:MAG: endonuclease III [Candidatus Deianiraeaceae bacterium]|jgi:endonuclease III